MAYFTGRKTIAHERMKVPRAKAELTYHVTEYWEDINQCSVACGAETTFSVTRKEGLKREDKQSLEGSITATLGAPLLADLKAAIKSRVERSVNWEVSTEVNRTFKLAAPKCGRRTDTTYQLMREYLVQYRAKSWLGHTAWRRRLTEYLGCYHQEPYIEHTPEACSCEGPPPRPYDRLAILQIRGSSLRVAANMLSDKLVLDLADHAIDVPNYDEARHAGSRIEMPSEFLPRSFLFLTDERHDVIQAEITLEHAENTQDLDWNFGLEALEVPMVNFIEAVPVQKNEEQSS